MVDPDNLRTASLYINNQLMSRGLLRDGHNIDFANPEAGEGGLQDTMGKVMSVINDLILRRDRDAENRESLSTTLRTMRADSQRQTTELTRQAEKLADTQRKLDSAEATERALRTQLKGAETSIHKLKDDAAKMKALLTQARAACANEIRKRDRQIDGLKKAVADASRVRGGGRSRDVLCISVTGEIGGDEKGVPAGATQDEGYSLRMETNAFLTELARGLSEENENLLALVRQTVESLRDMSGLDRGAESDNGAASERHAGAGNAGVVVVAPQKSAEELATELEVIMEHLRTILTNPSFVPIEEVEVREEAITRLRQGLETMESRWKDAVHMIDGWRKRMVSSGKAVDMEDLQMGLRLSPVRVRDVEETSDVVPMRLPCVQEEEEEEGEENDLEVQDYALEEEEQEQLRSPSPVESLHLVPAPGYEVEENDSDSDSSSIFQDEIDIEELEAEEPNVQVLQESVYEALADSPPLPMPPQLSPLKDSYAAGNRGLPSRDNVYRKRPGDFTTIVEENTWDLAIEEERAPTPPPHVIKPQSPQQQKKNTANKRSPPWQDQNRPSSTASYDSPLFGKSGERPSQTDPSRKLFSKPAASQEKLQTKSQPEPGNTGTKAPSKSAKRPNSSRESPDPLVTEIKRTSSDPINPPSRQQQASSTSSRQTVSSRPTSSSSAASSKPTITTVTSIQPQPQQPQVSRPRSPIRANPPASSSRLPRPNNPPPQQSPLTMATIAAKLAAAEREADAARVRAKLRAVRSGGQRRGVGVAAPATTANMTNAAASSGSSGENERPKSAGIEPKHEDNDDNPFGLGSGDVDPVKRDRDVPSTSRPITREGTPSSSAPVTRAKRQQAVPPPPPTDDAAADELAGSIGAGQQQQQHHDKDSDAGGGMIKPPKRRRDRTERRTSKVASRRRSTLSPWELETLIQGSNAPPTPAHAGAR
ncbi:Afadin and alpha-actinin-binding-domain-containing protein [Hypomontagnella submonticulosa]|nr:Afadin and alpha-actinin-binding-domain-containing protein [Hypomontagnella submonticulosa]